MGKRRSTHLFNLLVRELVNECTGQSVGVTFDPPQDAVDAWPVESQRWAHAKGAAAMSLIAHGPGRGLGVSQTKGMQ